MCYTCPRFFIMEIIQDWDSDILIKSLFNKYTNNGIYDLCMSGVSGKPLFTESTFLKSINQLDFFYWLIGYMPWKFKPMYPTVDTLESQQLKEKLSFRAFRIKNKWQSIPNHITI